MRKGYYRIEARAGGALFSDISHSDSFMLLVARRLNLNQHKISRFARIVVSSKKSHFYGTDLSRFVLGGLA